MTEARNRRKASYHVLIATLWLTLLVLAVKVWAGWAAQSLSLLAESLHTLIDGFSVMLSLIAVSSPYRFSSRDVWGHSRQETAMILGLTSFLGFTGFSLLVLSIQQLELTSNYLSALFPVQIGLPLVQLFGVIVAVSFCLTIFVRYEAGILESGALRLNAHQLLRHAWLMLLVFIALVGIWLGYAWVDPLLAILLVLLIIPGFWRILCWHLPLFVHQVAIAPEAIIQIIKPIEGISHCYQIRSWGIVGRQVIVEMRLTIHAEFAGMAPAIAEKIEGRIREKYGPANVRIQIDDRHPTSSQTPDGENLHMSLDWNSKPDWN
ncbi:MAG: cation diffusion facilitator family transporter [Elainellaceae cyanobacterium]